MIKAKIAAILDIPNNDDWEIFDSDPPLYLVHYKEYANLTTLGSIKGTIIDIDKGIIVSRSFGYTPIIETDEIKVSTYDEKIHLVDATNPNIEYTLENPEFYPGFDGILLRVFKYNGKTYYATNQRLTGEEQWGDSTPVKAIYDELRGPEPSPGWVYLFVLASSSLQVVSKTPVGDGYLIYLGVREIPSFEKHSGAKVPQSIKEFIPDPEGPVIFSPPELNIEEANTFLKRGFYNFETTSDPRLFPGEFVFAYVYEEDELTSIFRIESPAYRWRSRMRDKNPYLLQRFFNLANGKFIRADFNNERDVYLDRFPLLPPVSTIPDPWIVTEEKLNEEQTNEILSTVKGRLYNIYLAFVFSLPPSEQEWAWNLYEHYKNALIMIIQQIKYYYRKNEKFMPLRVKELISMAISFTQKDIEKFKTFEEGVNNYLEFLVNSEEGESLYRIYEYFKLREGEIIY